MASVVPGLAERSFRWVCGCLKTNAGLDYRTMNYSQIARAVATFGITAAMTCIGVEGLCGAFYAYETRELFWTRARPGPSKRSLPAPPSRDTAITRFMLSPYFGYVVRPDLTGGGAFTDQAKNQGYTTVPYYATWTGNNYGFTSDRDYPVPTGPNDFVVGVFGGSVAFYLAFDARDWIIESLRKLPQLAGK